jgi:hypothetical protein
MNLVDIMNEDVIGEVAEVAQADQVIVHDQVRVAVAEVLKIAKTKDTTNHEYK